MIIWCKNFKNSKYRGLREQERQRMTYKNGVEKYHLELDCVEIVKSLRQIKAWVKTVLNEHQQALTLFHRDSVVSCEKPLSYRILTKIVDREILNRHLDRIPTLRDSKEEIQKYEQAVERFMGDFALQELKDEDYRIMKTVK